MVADSQVKEPISEASLVDEVASQIGTDRSEQQKGKGIGKLRQAKAEACRHLAERILSVS